MKKTAHVILIFLLLLQTGGIVLFYQGQQHQWQQHMQEVLNSGTKEYRTFTLTLRKYEASRVDENELCLDGKMYDVKSVKVNGDEVTICAIQDEKEDNILHKIKKIIAGSTHGKHMPPPLVELLTLCYILPPVTDLNFIREENIQQFCIFSDRVFSRNSDIYVPPPKA